MFWLWVFSLFRLALFPYNSSVGNIVVVFYQTGCYLFFSSSMFSFLGLTKGWGRKHSHTHTHIHIFVGELKKPIKKLWYYLVEAKIEFVVPTNTKDAAFTFRLVYMHVCDKPCPLAFLRYSMVPQHATFVNHPLHTAKRGAGRSTSRQQPILTARLTPPTHGSYIDFP